MRQKPLFAALALIGMGMGTANAALPLGPLFNPPPDNTLVSDNSAEVWIDVDASGFVDTGDILFGIVGYESIAGTGIGTTTGYNEFTAIQASRIVSQANTRLNPQGIQIADYVAAPLGAGDTAFFDWSTGIIDLDGIAANGTNYSFTPSALGAANDDKTFAVFFEDAALDYDRDNTVQIGLDGADNGTARWRIGLDFAVDPADTLLVTAPTDPTTSLVPPFPSSTSIAQTDIFVDATILAQNWGNLLFAQQITAGTGGFSSPSTGTLGSGDPWQIFDNQDTTASVERIPEPASIVLLATGVVGAGLSYRRRPKQR